jgi:DNA-binding NarL/FixJ family response regulator
VKSLPEWADPDRRADALDRVAAKVSLTDEQLAEVAEWQPKRLEPSSAELNALTYASHGLGVKEIADALGVGTETVHTHLAHARRKLAAKNTCHACCIAIRRGYLD